MFLKKNKKKRLFDMLHFLTASIIRHLLFKSFSYVFKVIWVKIQGKW